MNKDKHLSGDSIMFFFLSSNGVQQTSHIKEALIVQTSHIKRRQLKKITILDLDYIEFCD